jgi:hypothetical protein
VADSYRVAVLHSVPAAYWRLGEASGTVAADSSGNANHGTYVGPTLGAAGGIPDGDFAAEFDGSNDHVTCPDLNIVAATSFTLEAWVYLTGPGSAGATEYGTVFGLSGGRRILVGTSTGYLLSEVGGESWFASISGNPNLIPLNEWTHVVYVYDHSTTTQKFYVNGVAAGTDTPTTTPDWDGAFKLGAYNAGLSDYLFKGRLDEAAVYSRALPASEIAAHYAARWLAPTFAAWLATPVRTEYVLCEPEPSKTLFGFTAVGGGAPNTYSMAFARLHQTSVITGGMYGRVIGVQENATALTERASLAAVDAAAGSWWWDEPNELLYVHTSTGADPDTFTLVQASVRFYLANAPLVIEQTAGDATTAVYYLPWLTADLPRIRRKREGLLQGSMAVPEGQVSFVNGHEAWFTLTAPDGQWNWKNKPVRFYIGGEYAGMTLTRDQFAAMATMRVEDVAPNEEVCTFALAPLQRFAELELPVTPYFESDYANLGDGVRGTKKWIGYGRTTMRPDLTDTSSYGVYTVADADYQTLFAVHNVWAVHKSTQVWTLLTLTTHYTVDLTACTVTIVHASYPHATYEIAVDVTGKPDGLGSYLQTYADVVEDLLTGFLGVSAADLDGAAFTTAAAEATNELSLWIKSPRSLASILATAEAEYASLGRSSLGTVQQTVDGTWTIAVWNPNVDDITTTLQRRDFAEFRPKPKLKTIYPTVRVFYGYDHARAQWAVVEADDPATRYRTGSQDRLDLYTYLVDASDALRLAQRYQLLAGAVTVEAEFVERGALLAVHEAGGKAKVTYDPAPALAGAYDEQPFEVIDLEVTMAPKLGVRGVLSNFHGLGGRVGRWMETAAPAWSAATATERQTSGFWCDSNGLADPADSASANQSIWF